MDVDYIEQRVRELRPTIVDSVKEPTLATHLSSSSVISEQDALKVRTIMQNDTHRAAEELMDCVLRSTAPGKWKSFCDALESSGYDYIRRLLMSPNDDDDECKQHARASIKYFADDLATGIKGDGVIMLSSKLHGKHILNDVDKGHIQSELLNKGDYHAVLMLLDRMKCRVSPRTWYYEFLQALVGIGSEDLVEKIEPKFISNKEAFMEKFGPNGVDCVTSKLDDMSVGENILYAREDGDVDTNDLTEPPIQSKTYSLDDKISNHPGKEQYDSNTEVKLSSKVPEIQLGTYSHDDKIRNQTGKEQYDSNTDVKFLYKGPEMVKNIAVSEDEGDSEDNNSMASDYEETEEDQSDEVKTYELRSYQVELAQDAIAGRNTIICSETGTGKTWVALEIIKKHFQAAASGPRKVAFMARTSILVKQQADRFKRYLPMHKTKQITGEDEDSKQLNMYMDMNDIICLTPQILVNNLDIQAVKSVSEFSLLLLDECHHTRGDEPYNRLMRKYLVEKSEKVQGLPQVIGLTASIGVGKSRTEDEAVDYILRVMSCLDVRILSTVEKNIAALKEHTNMPEEETIPLEKPDIDPCKDILIIAIEETEDLLYDIALMIPEVIDLVTEKQPSEKESQSYNKWTIDLFKCAQLKVDDNDISRDICACARYLTTFNSALEINKLLRAKDVIKYLAEKHHQDSLHKEKHTKMERKLFQKLLDVQKKLRHTGKDTENPNIRTLSNTLKSMLDGKGEDSRALVFVKARATCKSLAEFLESDLGSSGYKTSPLYGKENRGFDDGMTESVQSDILEKFREGVFKVLVCTSVGNEGIDVPQCNIVLSYEYSGDEITKIQMKGRARQKHATITLMADEKMLEQDRINAYKAAMMYRALKRIKGLTKNYTEMKVRQFQTDEMTKYRFKVATEDYKKGRKSEEDHEILCGRCNIFACFVSDVRQMGSNHIAIDKSFADKVVKKEHRKPKTYDGLHKKYKMFCKKCGLDWGIVGICKGLECHVLKIENMKFRNRRTQDLNVYKKWLDQPYRVPEMTPEDVPRLLGNQL